MGEPAVNGYEPFVYRGRDGLRLAGRDYPGVPGSLPVVCLPGLTRTTRDFHDLAAVLNRRGAGHRVVSFDYRGRGLSDHNPAGTSYLLAVELQDVLDGMTDRGIERAAIVGTSRGGILAMMMAGVAAGRMAGAVINDIGTIVETAGLLRIQSYVGKPLPAMTWVEAAAMLRRSLGLSFPAYSDEDWMAQARQTFSDRDGRPVLDYDPALAEGLKDVKPDTPPIDLSAAFASLAGMPVMLIRGSETDLLTRETVEAMKAAHPGLVAVEASGEGHPPALRGELAERIAAFVTGLR